jgi:hypothetical protein
MRATLLAQKADLSETFVAFGSPVFYNGSALRSGPVPSLQKGIPIHDSPLPELRT